MWRDSWVHYDDIFIYTQLRGVGFHHILSLTIQNWLDKTKPKERCLTSKYTRKTEIIHNVTRQISLEYVNFKVGFNVNMWNSYWNRCLYQGYHNYYQKFIYWLTYMNIHRLVDHILLRNMVGGGGLLIWNIHFSRTNTATTMHWQLDKLGH